VTLAPELPGALEVARSLVSRGVVVSAGHSNATTVEAGAGFDAGIRYVTHLFNAMRPFDHHEPGLAGAALRDPRVTVGVIPDGVHVAPTALDLAWRLAVPDRFSIVTDAVAAVATPSGEQRLGSQEVVLDGSAARLRDGTLAGSIVGMDQAVRNVVAFTGAPAEAVIRAVTTIPARLLALDDRATLSPGSRADLVVLTPTLDVLATIVVGRVVFATDDRWG
jgi:N-acetylglucosamine-6-phosphate deacetylase